MSTRHIIETVKSEAQISLNEIESKELLKQAGINVLETRLATSRQEAITISKHLGFPIVLKIASPDILHKSDAGGVKLGLDTPEQVDKAYDQILKATSRKHPQARVQGISVQKMARPGVEVIIGMSKDTQFGPVIMFGLGGIWVEIMKDVSLRIAPLSKKDAAEMIREIKGYPLLAGYRGQKPVDVSKLEEFILKLSSFAEQHPEVKEIDLNPIYAYDDGAVAVDARIILEGSNTE